MADDDASVEDLVEQVRKIKVSEFVTSAALTLSSLAYGKLDVRDFDDARLAIDALGVLVPLLAGDSKDEIARTLSTLQLAFARAVTATVPPPSE